MIKMMAMVLLESCEDDHNRSAMPSAAEKDKSFSQVSDDVGKRDFLLEIAQD